MKKLLALLLAMVMIFTLAACGIGNTEEPKQDDLGTSQEETQGETEKQETESPAAGTSGSAEVLHELFDIDQLAGISEFPDYAKKAIGDLRWCDDLGSDSFGQYNYNAYMKEVTQEDFETYVANLTANAPTKSEEGNIFGFYWDWGQITGQYFPDSGTLDTVLAVK